MFVNFECCKIIGSQRELLGVFVFFLIDVISLAKNQNTYILCSLMQVAIAVLFDPIDFLFRILLFPIKILFIPMTVILLNSIYW